MALLHESLTSQIIGAFFDVYNELGYGFLEKVYQNALYIELCNRGLRVEAQKQIKVNYKGVQVGEYYADFLINNTVIIEIKAAEGMSPSFEKQLFNYLKGTGAEIGLLLNFGPKPAFIRRIMTVG